MNKSHLLLGAVCASVSILVTTVVNAAVLPLEGRLARLGTIADYQAYYDPNLNITWMTQSNLQSSNNTLPFDTWNNQSAWVASAIIFGVSGWRLPSFDVNRDGTVVNCFGGGVSGCADNEMGFLYWEEGITVATNLPFNISNLDTSRWSSTDLGPLMAWAFDFRNGDMWPGLKNSDYYGAWLVRSGDIGVVPVPAAVWLFGSALGLLGWMKRRKAEQ